MVSSRSLCSLSVAGLLAVAAPSQDLDALKSALGDGKLGAGWIFEDIDQGFATARKTGKPLLVVFR